MATETEFHHTDVCIDCLMLIANGDTPPEMTEEETEEWLATVDDRYASAGHCDVDAFGDECPTWTDEAYCQCEGHFSWSACQSCGSTLGGARYPATVHVEVG